MVQDSPRNSSIRSLPVSKWWLMPCNSIVSITIGSRRTARLPVRRRPAANLARPASTVREAFGVDSRMPPRRIPRGACAALAIVCAVLLGACRAEEPAPKVTVNSAAPVPRPPTPSDSACPRDGKWKACHLEDRINKAGMGIKLLDTIRVPYFPEAGVRYRIGKTAKLVTFYFADSAAGAAATAQLDKLRLTPPGDTIGKWPSAPFEAIRSANMIAVLFEVNATQAERVRLALTAGAPQPYVEQAQTLPPATAR
jgi:hypothetical protein